MSTRRRPDVLADPRSCSGFTLLEVTMGIAFVTVAMIGLGTLLVANENTHDAAYQEAVVANHFRFMAEQMRAMSFPDLVTNLGGQTTGPLFDIASISGTATITFFVDETDNSPQAQQLGLPRDLDGDGQPTNTDVTASYALLPVQLTATWNGPLGLQTRQIFLFLSQEQ